jgi:imidazole glycerol-phosphate synthase subunit HisH
MRVGIIDYGAGNLRSICNALDKVNCEKYVLVDNPDMLRSCDKMILPGVGAFGSGMEQLRSRSLDEVIIEAARRGVPLLGICLGMQFLATYSEEFGLHRGLGLVPGNVTKIEFPSDLGNTLQKVPVIGWKELTGQSNSNHFSSAYVGAHFYFVHSFQFTPSSNSSLNGSYLAGNSIIPAVVATENITGVQFHPEKSGEKGLEFINSFLHS